MVGEVVGIARKDGGGLALLVRHPEYADPFDVPVYGREAQALAQFPSEAIQGRQARFTRLRSSWKRAPRSPLFIGLIEPKSARAVASSKEKQMPRELIDTGKDKRYVRRNKKGEFKESDDVGRSLAADRRKKAKKVAKKGEGDRGDQKTRKKAAKKTSAKKTAKKAKR